jgi:hypothetical protein
MQVKGVLLPQAVQAGYVTSNKEQETSKTRETPYFTLVTLL